MRFFRFATAAIGVTLMLPGPSLRAQDERTWCKEDRPSVSQSATRAGQCTPHRQDVDEIRRQHEEEQAANRREEARDERQARAMEEAAQAKKEQAPAAREAERVKTCRTNRAGKAVIFVCY